MNRRPAFACAIAVLAACAALSAAAERKTICTVTVNSDDEKQALRARLPKGDYEFVELLQSGRPDWLRAACERKVQCDALVISGHFNAGETFYSDKVASHAALKMDELERASCSESCPGVFAHLKEVYLFGCESLNPDSSKYASAYGESGRDRMRRLFAGVPKIYGFSGPAPVGPTAAALINRYFDQGGGAEIGTGRANPKLLSVFSRNNMVGIPGLREHEARMAYRRQVCQFYDDRRTPAQKLAFIHSTMRADMSQGREFFERIENFLASLSDAERSSPDFAQELARVSADQAVGSRFLAAARGERPEMRARRVKVAATLGWLSTEQEHEEIVRMAGDLAARDAIGYAEVDLLCSLNSDGALDAAAAASPFASMSLERTGAAAAMACLGRKDAHARVVRALVSADERDVKIAQAYLRNRPVADMAELRAVAARIAHIGSAPAQVRAIDTLARLNIADRQVIDQLAQAFADAKSPSVQRAIAEVFIRSDSAALPKAELAAIVRRYRLKVSHGDDLIEQLLRKLQS